jgi:hypothetical protein
MIGIIRKNAEKVKLTAEQQKKMTRIILLHKLISKLDSIEKTINQLN